MDINELTGPAIVNTAHIGPKLAQREEVCVGTARKCADGGRLNVFWALTDLRGRRHPQASTPFLAFFGPLGQVLHLGRTYFYGANFGGGPTHDLLVLPDFTHKILDFKLIPPIDYDST